MFRNSKSVFNPFAPKGIGEVVMPITPSQDGRIKWNASEWPARLSQEKNLNIAPTASKVQILGQEGITLLVMPLG